MPVTGTLEADSVSIRVWDQLRLNLAQHAQLDAALTVAWNP